MSDTITPDDPRLVTLRKRRQAFTRKQKARDTARDELFDAIRAAAEVPGVSRQWLVDNSGVARATVFDALRREPDQSSDR